MKIRINSYLPITKVEGPGSRFCIWVQGCSIHCKGCANSHMWNKNGGIEVSCQEMVNMIKNYSSQIEGITFLGGEPLEQIEEVTYIAKEVQKIGLSVLIFTGFEYQKIKTSEKVIELLKYTDILIDGKYDKDEQDFSRPWVGSKNQKYYFISQRYSEDILNKYKNKFEIRIDKNNKISFNGMGDFSKIKNYKIKEAL